VARRTRSAYGTGLLLACTAYLMWGLFPIYFYLLKPAQALEVLGHRMTWTLLFLLLVVSLRHLWKSLRAYIRQPRVLGLLALAAIAISLNWGLYIWAVDEGQVVEASLGYFINPLVAVLIGVGLLGERLRRLQWTAVALGGLSVAVLTVAYGRPPWIALGLAISFATYGYLKKLANVGAVESLTIETTYLFPFALLYLIILESSGNAAFGHVSAGNTALLALAGIVTALPLLAYGGAVIRAPLSTIGLLQYITPVMQFILGLTFFHEAMTTGRWIGFAIVWGAVVLLSIDAIRTARDPNWTGGIRHGNPAAAAAAD